MRLRNDLNKFSEAHILKIASDICNISPSNILLIGGGMVLPEITGFKRLRARSNDLDFIVNGRGFSDALNSEMFQERNFVENGRIVYTSVNGMTVALFVNGVRGYDIPREIYEFPIVKKTSLGIIYHIPWELNTALKIRRGLTKGHIYAKDAQDLASMVMGGEVNGNSFNVTALKGYMQNGVCDSCGLGSYLKCLEQLRQGTDNLRERERPAVLSVIDVCGSEFGEVCKYDS